MDYDCIVVGLGVMGSSALHQAAGQGWKVLGIEQLGAVHDQGSSHGQTRIIRTAYFEHPDYVPLARQSWHAWERIQAECGHPLVQQTGLLQMGPESGEVIQGVLQSAREHALPVQTLSAADVRSRFPVFRPRNDHVGVFEKSAGFLRVESCVANLLKLARQSGAEIKSNVRVDGWQAVADDKIQVQIQGSTIRTRRLVLAAGAWSKSLLADLGVSFQILRKQQHWFQIDRNEVKYQNGFPCYLFETERGVYYGFPEIDHLGIKVAEHSGGVETDADQVNRDLKQDELQGCEAFMDRFLEFSRRRLVHHSVCMYTMSEDGHFVVDTHPNHPNVVFATGMSGHGFKFAPVIGSYLIDLLNQQPRANMEFLRLKRGTTA